MKRILFLAADLCSRGAEHQMVTVATLLKNRGYDVSFVCYHTNNFFEHILVENKIPVTWLKFPNYVKRMFSIRNYVRKGHYDAVISFLQVDNFLNDFSALGGHKWKVITGERSSKESLLTNKKGKLFALFQNTTSYIVCNSENARNMWLRHYPQYENKLHVIYNNVFLSEITSVYRMRFDDKTHVVVAGAYSKVKNPVRVIEAISRMEETDRTKLILDWYGNKKANIESGSVLSECEKLVNKYHLENVVRLFDATKDIANRMNEADYVALFSLWEGLPNSICEGMMIGKPIIMTRMSDYSKLVNVNNGFLCDSMNIDSIKEAFINAINVKKDDLIAMGKYSKEKAQELFSSEVVAKKWILLLESS